MSGVTYTVQLLTTSVVGLAECHTGYITYPMQQVTEFSAMSPVDRFSGMETWTVVNFETGEDIDGAMKFDIVNHIEANSGQ